MDKEIGYIHHVGHVVHDLEKARELYQKLGFLCPAPAYPTLSRHAGEPAKPFGAANMHATFARNFVEIMAVVTEESHLSDDAHPIPLQVPPAVLPQVIESIERTIAKISASLARFEGLHILVFQTADANEAARRFDQVGVGHSGVNRVQQPHQLVPMGVITKMSRRLLSDWSARMRWSLILLSGQSWLTSQWRCRRVRSGAVLFRQQDSPTRQLRKSSVQNRQQRF